ncbi:hypothetical protein Tco_0105785 [Tanacetum coccineum]
MSNNSETDSEISLSVFYVRSSDEENTPANDRFSKADGFHAIPPPITGNFLTPRADISFAGKTNETNTQKPKTICESVNRDKVIIEDWNSDDEDDVSEVQTVSPVKTNETQTVKTRVDKIGQTSQKQGIRFKKIKACFVCKSTDHLIKDCNFHDKQSQEPKLKTVVNTGPRVDKPVWDNTKRVNHQKFSKYPHLRKTFVPSGVLTRTSLITPVKQNEKRAVHTVSTARTLDFRPFAPKIAQTGGAIRPIYPRMDNVRPRGSYSPIKRAVVNTGKGKMDTDLRKSRWGWRPKLKLEFCDKHNMVAYLVKSESSEGFDEIIDFLTSSHIYYALTENPIIFVSLIEQFWETAVLSTTEEGLQAISATIDGHEQLITEASLRRHLKLEDAEGISSLSNEEIFEQLAHMGEEDFLNLVEDPQYYLVQDEEYFLVITIREVSMKKPSDETEVNYTEERLPLKLLREHEVVRKVEMEIKVSTAEAHVYTRRSAKDKGKAIMEEPATPKKVKKRTQVQLSMDEELARKMEEEERVKFNAEQEARALQEEDEERLNLEATCSSKKEYDNILEELRRLQGKLLQENEL